MDGRRVSTRWTWLLPILIVFGLPGWAAASGLLGISLPRLPIGCGESPCPGIASPVLYVGWMEDRQGVAFSVYATGAPAGGVVLRYPNRGLWVGVSESVCLTRDFSFTASGWCVLTSRAAGREFYDLVPPSERSWDATAQWWFVDGLVAMGSCGGFSVLAGLRYDHYTSRLDNSYNETTPLLPTYSGDMILNAWIPLIGAEYAYRGSDTHLVFRTIGFPLLFGGFKFADVDRLNSVISDGHWTRGYFLEVLAEYSKRVGPGSAGIFARWNGIEANSKGNSAVIFPVHLRPSPHDVTANRSSWTIGGNFTLNFNVPL
jgi:hypothetical protein